MDKKKGKVFITETKEDTKEIDGKNEEEEGEEEEKNILTIKFLKQTCEKNGGYSTPKLNDIIYLQCKGVIKIENLEEYVQLKCIHIQNNAISTIEGLENQKLLRSLFIHQNCIRKIQNLSHLKDLRVLNISQNFIEKLENLGECTLLENLNVSENQLKKVEDIIEVLKLKKMQVFDVSKNLLEEEDVLEKVFSKMEKLSLLKLDGNACVRKIKSYRKKMICEIKTLNYLDEMPVFKDERRLAHAWNRGGMDEVRKEREKMKQEKEEKDKKNFEFMDNLVKDASKDEEKKE